MGWAMIGFLLVAFCSRGVTAILGTAGACRGESRIVFRRRVGVTFDFGLGLFGDFILGTGASFFMGLGGFIGDGRGGVGGNAGLIGFEFGEK